MNQLLWLACTLLLVACSSKQPAAERDAGAPADAGEVAEPPARCKPRSPCLDASQMQTGDASPPSDASDASVACERCATWPPASLVSATLPSSLTLLAPESVRPLSAFPVTVRADDAWSGTVEVRLGATRKSVRLYRGAGAASLSAPASDDDLTIEASIKGLSTSRALRVQTRSERALSGELSGADLAWDEKQDVTIDGVVTVAAGSTLRVGAGTRVALAANARLTVLGKLVVTGSEKAPVLFHAASSVPWGEIDFQAKSEGTLSYVMITQAGGDASRVFGHSKSEPVIRATEASVSVDHAVIADNPGKAFASERSRITIEDTINARNDTGGEHEASLVRMSRSHTFEIPDADGKFDDDDNDGIYLLGAFTAANGEQESVLSDVVFAAGEDDGIDHNGALVRVERAWIEGVRHEGVAASSGRRITLYDVVISGCEQGIEAGYGSPEVVAERVYVHDNDVGLRIGDSYDREVSGSMTVSNSVIADNETDTRNYVNILMGPLDGALVITCSWSTEVELPGTCNQRGVPQDTCEVAAPDCSCEAPTPALCL